MERIKGVTSLVKGAVVTPSKRIVAFDLLRGWFLMVVIIDHVELYPSGFDFLSGRGQLWVSAAEGFFFLSGLLVGMIYRKKADPQATPGGGMKLVFKKLWGRALLLYVCAVSLTLFYTAWALWHGNAEAIKYGAATQLDWATVWNTLQLKYVYGWSDFLSYYVTFMVAAPFIVWLLIKQQWRLVVLASVLLWLNQGTQFTHAWQLIFFGGLMTGFYWKQLQAKVASWKPKTQKIAWRTVVSVAVITMAVSYINLFVLGNLRNNPDAMASAWGAFLNGWNTINEAVWLWFDKFTLGPGRIAMFALWFAAAFLVVQRYAAKIPSSIAKTFTLLGQNSLFVYGTHSIFVFAVHAYLPKDWGFAFNFAITAAVLAVMVGITYVKVALKRRSAAIEAAAGGTKLSTFEKVTANLRGAASLLRPVGGRRS